MASTPEKLNRYKQLISNLLPKGRLWKVVQNSDSVFSKFIKASAEEFCRVDDRTKQMLLEVDPRTTFESVDQWEAALGIPDECTPEGQDLAERRTQIVQKLTNVGGISKTFYEFIIAQLGFTATVENRLNFIVGRARVGDALTNYFNRVFLVGQNTVGEQLKVVGWRYYFNVELPATSAQFFEVGLSTVGQPLVAFSNPLIECTIRKLKPAHSGVIFTFV